MREPTEKQLEQREKFTKATATCKAESKLKKGSVWGVSDYNTCIRKELTKKKEK